MLEQKIKDWFHEQGYALEMRVAAEFQHQQLTATLANFYRDPISGISRQIDVIASRDDATGYFRSEIVVECKKSSSHPWLLLSSSSSSDGYSPMFEFALTSRSARSALIDGRDEAFLELPWIKYPKSRGVGLVQALGKSENDVAFKAASGAMAAAIARRKHLSKNGDRMVFVFPVVVLDNQLFEAKLNELGQVDVAEIQEALVYFPMHFGEDEGHCVYVTTASNLPSFVLDASKAVSALEEFTKPVARRLLDKAKNRTPVLGPTW